MNKIRKSIFDISWILIQVGIVWILSEFFGLKSWSNFCKGMLILFLLGCTLSQWFNKKIVYRKIRDLTNKLIKHICKALKGVDVLIKGSGGVLIIIFSDILKVIYIYQLLNIN